MATNSAAPASEVVRYASGAHARRLHGENSAGHGEDRDEHDKGKRQPEPVRIGAKVARRPDPGDLERVEGPQQIAELVPASQHILASGQELARTDRGKRQDDGQQRHTRNTSDARSPREHRAEHGRSREPGEPSEAQHAGECGGSRRDRERTAQSGSGLPCSQCAA